jgi:hypothetical protein
LMLERPAVAVGPARAPRREALLALIDRLESWLPAEESQLSRARTRHRPEPDREAEWRTMLGLYEQLCSALLARGGRLGSRL